jgi:XTP/dITP diphosphohydrolase
MNALAARQTLFVATTNQGKLRDFAVAAAASSGGSSSGSGSGRNETYSDLWSIESLPGLAQIEPPEENGSSFYDNACLKALYYATHAPGTIVLADDSGLEVDALSGAPGIYSARFAARLAFPAPADPQAFDDSEKPAISTMLDARNNACLLDQLAPYAALENRTAHYRCVLAAARTSRDGSASIIATATGTVTGQILLKPQGTGGFGYDPLFLIAALNRTMAELDPETRLQLSHRGRALRQLLPQLSTLV